MEAPYYETVSIVERLHRRFMDVIKSDLERAGILDINNVQCLILHNIGDSELTVGELTMRGYYLGSNVSYNIKKMVENGYLVQERSKHDKRSIRVKLSNKGRKLDKALANMYVRHIEDLQNNSNLSNEKLTELNAILKNLELFWNDEMGRGNIKLEDG